MIKIDCVSDLHGHLPQLEGGDLLIVAGDLTAADTIDQHVEFCRWIEKQPYKKIIVIAGNHDNFIEHDECLCIADYDGIKTEYLQDYGFVFQGFKIWGSPWTKTFAGMNPKCKAFTVDTDEELAEKWAMIPEDIDILVTHSPPYGVMDMVDCEPVGSESLSKRLYSLKNPPRLCVFGHIHEGYGKEEWTDVILVNASHVNELYQPVNKPITVIL